MLRLNTGRLRSLVLSEACASFGSAASEPSQEPAAPRLWDGFSSAVAKPLLRKLDQRNNEILGKHQFKPFQVDTTVCKVHGVHSAAGNGVGAAIFVHGLSSSAVANAPVLSTLTGLFDYVAAFDLICHGKNEDLSEVDLERLRRAAYESIRTIAATQRRPVTLFGHSMGAYLVLDIGCEVGAKQWIAGIVAGSPPGAGAASEHERREAVQLFKMQAKGHAFTLGKRACPEFNGALMPVVAAVAWHRFRRPSVQSVIRSDVSGCTLADERLRNVQVPALLCWGEKDGLVPIHHMRHLTDIMPRPHTRVVTSPKIGHANFVDNAPIFIEAIAHFMQSVDGVERRVSKPRSRMRESIGTLRERLRGTTFAEVRAAIQG